MTYNLTLRKKLLCTTMATAAVAFAGQTSAWAQSAPQKAEAAPAVEEVVVTGSRIVREGYEAPTPLTVVGTDQLQNSASSNLMGFLSTLPALANSANGASNGVNTSSASGGAAYINLRALSVLRTLVLLDGQRLGFNDFQGGSAAPNIATIPQQLVERVDIVTGGASAVYGSDAVAGVVNFVLNKKFTGVKGEISGGLTNYGDGKNYKIDLSAGFGFGPDDRGHVLLSGEHLHDQGTYGQTRPWNHEGWLQVANPAYGTGAGQSTSVPAQLVVKHAAGIYAYGGTITAGPLKGTAFGAGGVPYKIDYGSLASGNTIVGTADAIANNDQFWEQLSPTVDSQNLFTRVSYDITDNLNAFFQYDYATAASYFQYTHMPQTTNNIKVDNAFIPASVRAALIATGQTQFNIGTLNGDLPFLTNESHNITNRINAGLEGNFNAFGSNWKWNATYTYNATHQAAYAYEKKEGHGGLVTSLYQQAIDAVVSPTTGQIVCRVALTDPTSTCKPWNLMGQGVNNINNASFLRPDFQYGTLEQTVYGGSITGEPFEIWAGPVSTALSFEHRKDQVNVIRDPEANAVNRPFGSHSALTGQQSVTEGAVELLVPLAKGETWAQAWDLSAAARFTGYELSGFTTTWKLGTTYAPIDDIKFRVTYSRDMRAPTLNELFAAPVAQSQTVLDVGNRQTLFVGLLSSNSALTPEVAHTLGAGVVLSPKFLDGFTMSVDYWDVDISNAILQLQSQNVLDGCTTGAYPAFCSLITRAPAAPGSTLPGTITQIAYPTFNVATQNVRGIDLEASYRTPVSALMSDWNGELSLHGNMTIYLRNYQVSPFSPAVDKLGEFGQQPNWKATASITYGLEPVAVTLTGRAISSQIYNATFITCTSGCPVSLTTATTINNNHIPGAFYLDANVTYKLELGGADSSLFISAKNILNRDPPFGGGSTLFLPVAGVGTGAFDTMGAVYPALVSASSSKLNRIV